MKIINNGLIKFDQLYPMYNFFFPNPKKNLKDAKLQTVLGKVNENISARALYFHIPFCETICTFCPFTRGVYKSDDQIEQYVEALLHEIDLKAAMFDMKAVPIRAIFFGGGTPSLLNPSQIRRIGRKISENFDLSQLKEFSFEIEIKSINEEKADALKEIGVTNPRFGLQSFSPRWRKHFNLTSTLANIDEAVHILNPRFRNVSFDILYGMNGQDETELLSDLRLAANLGTTNIDVYPINNVMTQPKLHRSIKKETDSVTSATRKFSMKLLANEYLKSLGFMPHNGHGYFRTNNKSELLTDEYSFVYHEHVYGYADYDLIGFGVNSISSTRGHVITTVSNRNKYIESVLAENQVPCFVSEHDSYLDELRPFILRLPYHGEIKKNKLKTSGLPQEIFQKLEVLKKAGLVVEDKEKYAMTKDGWNWYSNIMYYLMPKFDQVCINSEVVHELRKDGKFLTQNEVLTSLT